MNKGKIKAIMKRVNNYLRKKYYNPQNLGEIVSAQEGAFKAKQCVEALLNGGEREFNRLSLWIFEQSHFDKNSALLGSFKYTLKELSEKDLYDKTITKVIRDKSTRIQEELNREVNNIKKRFLKEASEKYFDFERRECEQAHAGIKDASKCLKFLLCKNNVEISGLEMALELFETGKTEKRQPYFNGFRAMMHKYNKLSFYSDFVIEARKVKK